MANNNYLVVTEVQGVRVFSGSTELAQFHLTPDEAENAALALLDYARKKRKTEMRKKALTEGKIKGAWD